MNKTAIIDGVEYNLVPVEKEVDRAWRAEPYERYYFVCDIGGVKAGQDHKYQDSDYHYLTGNYFKTEEQAEQYKLLLQAKGRVRLKALELGGGEGIDWEDYNQVEYTFSYGVNGNLIKQNCTGLTLYFETYFYWADSTKRDEFLVACKEDLEFIYNYNYNYLI